MAFIQPQAGRTADVVEQQCRLARVTDMDNEVLLNFRAVEQLHLFEKVRDKLATGRYGRVGAMPVVVIQPGIGDGLADSMATVTTELARFAKDFDDRYRRGRQ